MSSTSAWRNSLLAACAAGCAHAAPLSFSGRAGADPVERRLALARHGNTLVRCRPDDAEVLVDGVLQGQARDFDGTTRLLALSPGRHELLVRRSGYGSVRLEVVASADARQTLDLSLNPVSL